MANLKRRARRQAAAEYVPQKRQVRRGLQGELGSLNTMEDALHSSIKQARRMAGNSALQGDDLKTVLGELARQYVDVSGGVQLQKGTARREAMTELADLSASQGASSRSILDSLLTQRQERRQELADRAYEEEQAKLENLEEYELDLKADVEKQKLGLTGGLTPTQKREKAESKQNANFWARQLMRAAAEDPEGPGDPKDWDDSVWDGLIGAVQGKEGVDSIREAKTAVDRLREKVQPGILDALKTLALGAAPAAATLGLGLLSGDGGGSRRRR